MKTKKQIGAVIATIFSGVFVVSAHADTQMVNPDAKYSYKETINCASSVAVVNNYNPAMGVVITAMLGRLPACEVENIILAGSIQNGKVNQVILSIKKRIASEKK